MRSRPAQTLLPGLLAIQIGCGDAPEPARIALSIDRDSCGVSRLEELELPCDLTVMAELRAPSSPEPVASDCFRLAAGQTHLDALPAALASRLDLDLSEGTEIAVGLQVFAPAEATCPTDAEIVPWLQGQSLAEAVFPGSQIELVLECQNYLCQAECHRSTRICRDARRGCQLSYEDCRSACSGDDADCALACEEALDLCRGTERDCEPVFEDCVQETGCVSVCEHPGAGPMSNPRDDR